MQRTVHRRQERLSLACTAFCFVIVFLIATLASCAPPTAKAFGLSTKPKVNRVHKATFYSDRR